VNITFDPVKRDKVLAERGLDFARADVIFAGPLAEVEDTRRNYGEKRFITAGLDGARIVVIVWTPRDGSRRVISMRYAHGNEEILWQKLIG
jgi:uncharacterized DUF497 family protein